jgi:hypothetical protein
MDRFLKIVFIIFTVILFTSGISPQSIKHPDPNSYLNMQDSISEKQLLFNGRIWRSLYSDIIGDEFLLSKDWLIGDLVINDIQFKNVPLRYDIYNDQLITMMNQGTFVQLNKELIKEFILFFENRKYLFENFRDTQKNPVRGFGQILYKGKICLIMKETKEIKELAVQNRYDEFSKTQALFILKDGRFYRLSGKKDLLKVLSDKDEKLQNFIRENKLRIRKNNPERFIPVLNFYDNLK